MPIDNQGKIQECDADGFVNELLQQLREKAAQQKWEDAFRLGDQA